MRSGTITTILVSGLATLLVLGACSKKEPAPSGGGGAAGVLPSDAGSKLSEAASQAANELARNYTSELDQQQSQLGALKASAGSLGDAQLDSMITTIEGKLKQVTGKLADLKNAEGGTAEALGKEVQKLLSEVGPLMKQAQQRLASLQGGG